MSVALFRRCAETWEPHGGTVWKEHGSYARCMLSVSFHCWLQATCLTGLQWVLWPPHSALKLDLEIPWIFLFSLNRNPWRCPGMFTIRKDDKSTRSLAGGSNFFWDELWHLIDLGMRKAEWIKQEKYSVGKKEQMKDKRERRRRTKDLSSPPNDRAMDCGGGEIKRTELSDRDWQPLSMMNIGE